MPIVTTRCVVLQTHPYSDTSKILRLMTAGLGPLSVIARGALRPKSRLSGVLEPFAEGMTTLYVKPNRDLHNLSDFELITERQSLGRDLRRYAGASVLCELVLRLAPAERDERLFESLLHGLDSLVAADPATVPGVALATIWRLVETLGFAPSLDVCASCGRPMVGEAAAFDVREASLFCRRCVPHGSLLPAEQVEALRRHAGGNATDEAPSGVQARLLVDFIRHHAAEGTRLRSLDFLLQEETL